MVAVALTFGESYGALFSVLAAIAHNLLVIPPFLELSWPTTSEVVRLVGFITISLLLPTLAKFAGRLRTLAFSAGDRVPVPARTWQD
jgi:hypothetical protein